MQGKVDHVQVLRKPRAMALRVLVVLGVHLVLSGVQSNLIPRIVSTSSLLELAVPVSEKIQNERCRNHSALYLKDLKKLKLWATESEFKIIESYLILWKSTSNRLAFLLKKYLFNFVKFYGRKQ